MRYTEQQVHCTTVTIQGRSKKAYDEYTSFSGYLKVKSIFLPAFFPPHSSLHSLFVKYLDIIQVKQNKTSIL